MSKINDLIKELCPKGVPYKEIKELCIVTRGRVISKNELRENEGEYPVYSSQTLNNGVFGKINTYDFDGEYVQWTTDGANAGSIFYRNGKFSVTNVCGLLKVRDEYKNKLNTNFLNYILGSVSKSYVNYATSNPKLMSNVVEKIKVALPPLEVQEEIVKILDKFGELEAELEARKSQYEFWRGKLLDRTDNLKSIGELFEFKNGINKSKDCFGSGNPIINYVDVYKNNKITTDIVNGLVKINDTDLDRYSCKRGDVFFTRTSETREEVGMAAALIDDMNNSVFSGFLLRARPITDLLIPEYCAYCFSSPRVRQDIISYANFTTRATVTGAILSKVKIYVPSKDEQERIVLVLDKMYSLINSFIEGLPAEIELRRKQYEYYRNKLLSFEELVVNE